MSLISARRREEGKYYLEMVVGSSLIHVLSAPTTKTPPKKKSCKKWKSNFHFTELLLLNYNSYLAIIKLLSYSRFHLASDRNESESLAIFCLLCSENWCISRKMRSEIANIYIIAMPIAIRPRLAILLRRCISCKALTIIIKCSQCACDLDDNQRVEEFEPVEISLCLFSSIVAVARNWSSHILISSEDRSSNKKAINKYHSSLI